MWGGGGGRCVYVCVGEVTKLDWDRQRRAGERRNSRAYKMGGLWIEGDGQTRHERRVVVG